MSLSRCVIGRLMFIVDFINENMELLHIHNSLLYLQMYVMLMYASFHLVCHALPKSNTLKLFIQMGLHYLGVIMLIS